MKSNTSSISPALSICFSDVTEASWSPTTWLPCFLPGSIPTTRCMFLSLQAHQLCFLWAFWAVKLFAPVPAPVCATVVSKRSVQSTVCPQPTASLAAPTWSHAQHTDSQLCALQNISKKPVWFSYLLNQNNIHISNIIDIERFFTICCRKSNADIPDQTPKKTTSAHYDLGEAPETSNPHQCSGDKAQSCQGAVMLTGMYVAARGGGWKLHSFHSLSHSFLMIAVSSLWQSLALQPRGTACGSSTLWCVLPCCLLWITYKSILRNWSSCQSHVGFHLAV